MLFLKAVVGAGLGIKSCLIGGPHGKFFDRMPRNFPRWAIRRTRRDKTKALLSSIISNKKLVVKNQKTAQNGYFEPKMKKPDRIKSGQACFSSS